MIFLHSKQMLHKLHLSELVKKRVFEKDKATEAGCLKRVCFFNFLFFTVFA